MLSTRFTTLVGCTIPMQPAGMGGASPPELAAAVSYAGAFGMVSTARAGGSDPDSVAALIEWTRALKAQLEHVVAKQRLIADAVRSLRLCDVLS